MGGYGVFEGREFSVLKKIYLRINQLYLISNIKEIKKMANIIKVRDDYEPIQFESTSGLNKFKICEDSSASWTDQEFTVKIYEVGLNLG